MIGIVPGTDIGGRIYEGMPCIVCQKKVEEGTGAQAMPPMLPAVHSACLPVAVAKIEAAKK